jgi:hypothetical protein
MGAIKKYTDNEFYFVTSYRKDSCSAMGTTTVPYIHPVIGRMDSLGAIQELRHYSLNFGCGNSPADLIITEDRGIVTWGRENRFYVLKVDSVGDVEWAKHFGDGGNIHFVKELPGGDLLAGMNLPTAGAVVARLDADGNFLWCKSYLRPNGMVHDAVIEVDGSFVITGVTDNTIQNMFIPLPISFQPKLFMMKLTADGDVIWCRGYDSAPNHWHTPRASRIVKTMDENYTILATLGYEGYNFFYRPFLMKTDLNGDTLWTRSMGKDGFDYYTQDLLAYSDGGFMLSGGVWGDLPQGRSSAATVFKTDSLGHFSCWERTHTVEVTDLFPTDSSFVLTSVDGATAHPAFANDTTFAPTATYDGCTFTTGIPPELSRSRKMSIRPNPTPGRITVSFPDPLQRDTYYSVIDATGRLLYQRPLPAGGTEEDIDLSRFGPGTYILRINDPDGQRNERVVVE